MLTHGEDVEAHALRSRGWTISAIARHLGRDRKTVRAYLNGERVPGVRARSAPDPLEPFVEYLTARFVDDPHVWASALYDEVRRLGYPLSYPSFARQVRAAGLRPHCEACTGVKGRDTIEIDHPPGEEIQWDWFERRNAPWGGDRLRVARHASALGQGPRRAGREDGPRPPHRRDGRGDAAAGRHRAGVAHRPPGDGDHAGNPRRAGLICPGRQALWGGRRAVPAAAGQPQGCRSSPRCASSRDGGGGRCSDKPRRCPALPRRVLRDNGRGARAAISERERTTVGVLADAEPLLALPPVPFPATIEVERIVADNASVAYRGNHYSVPPGLGGATLLVRQRLGSPTIDVVAPSGAILVTHRWRRTDRAHWCAVSSTELRSNPPCSRAFTTARPCDKKANRPPGERP